MKASQIGQLINGILTIVIGSLTLFGISQEKLTIIQGALLLTMPLVISITSTIDKVIDTKKSVVYSVLIFTFIILGGIVDYLDVFNIAENVANYIRLSVGLLVLILNFVLEFFAKDLTNEEIEEIKSARPKSGNH